MTRISRTLTILASGTEKETHECLCAQLAFETHHCDCRHRPECDRHRRRPAGAGAAVAGEVARHVRLGRGVLVHPGPSAGHWRRPGRHRGELERLRPGARGGGLRARCHSRVGGQRKSLGGGRHRRRALLVQPKLVVSGEVEWQGTGWTGGRSGKVRAVAGVGESGQPVSGYSLVVACQPGGQSAAPSGSGGRSRQADAYFTTERPRRRVALGDALLRPRPIRALVGWRIASDWRRHQTGCVGLGGYAGVGDRQRGERRDAGQRVVRGSDALRLLADGGAAAVLLSRRVQAGAARAGGNAGGGDFEARPGLYHGWPAGTGWWWRGWSGWNELAGVQLRGGNFLRRDSECNQRAGELETSQHLARRDV